MNKDRIHLSPFLVRIEHNDNLHSEDDLFSRNGNRKETEGIEFNRDLIIIDNESFFSFDINVP